jgi:hypothetical protein
MLMAGVMLARVHVVMTRRHGTGGHRGDRQVGSTQDERQISIDWRQHESRGYQCAQEQKPENGHMGPAWFPDVAHPCHRFSDS